MNGRTWGIALILVLLLAWPAPAALAQDAEQWKKMYDDALNQLKAAQERKNQLAAENERLSQQLEALKKEHGAMNTRLEELKRADADHAEKTFFLRVHYMAWQQFLGRNPEVQGKWQKFLEGAALGGPDDPNLLNRKWLIGEPPASQPSTQPATGPTTRPSEVPATMPTTGPAPATAPATAPASAPTSKP